MEEINHLPDRTLGRDPANLYSPSSYWYIALTLSHREIKQFMRLTSSNQKRVYIRWCVLALNGLCYKKVIHFEYYYEFTKKLKVHLHGILKIPKMKDISLEGLFNDLAKSFCRNGDCKYNAKCIHNNEYGITYKTPPITLDLIKDKDDYDTWMSYCKKSQPVEVVIESMS